MSTLLVSIVLGSWIPFVVLLFRIVGPRRAILVAVLGGYVLLPRDVGIDAIFGWFPVNKRMVTGLAVLLGTLIFDFKTVIRGRPRWVDLPMIGFVLAPLVSLAVNKFDHHIGSLEQVGSNVFEWGMPYLVGRLYLADREAPRDLSIAIVVAGLVSLPIAVFEMVLGPKNYLLGLIYGIKPHQHMVERLGGWRPEGFATNGIEFSTWLALASTIAVWLWLRRGWSPPRIPSWSPALALTLVTVAVRGIYGYACLAIGLTTAGLSHLLRTRFLIAILAFLPPAYMASRISGLWDGHQLAEIAGKLGKADSVAYRVRAESLYIKKVIDHGTVFGFGGTNSAMFDYFAKSHLWADGWWIHQFRSGGLVGLSFFLLALFLIPAGLGLALPAGRSGLASPGALAWGLALFVILHMIDSIHNMAYLPQTTMIGGSLASVFLDRRAIRPEVATIGRETAEAKTTHTAPLLITVVVLALIEILGQLPRTSSFIPPSSTVSDPATAPHSR